MGIDAWSTTAASNNAAPPDGAPEGMAASTVNNTMRQIMASVRAWYENAQWINLGLTPTRLDGDSFSLTGDVTATFHVGRRIKVTGSATGYATISASSYSSPNTTIDVTMDAGSLPVTLSAVYVSILSATNSAMPSQANPTWTAATGGSLTLSTPLGTASGGTGANTVAGARSALGVSATGSDTTYSFRSNNLSDLTNAATARTNLGVAIGTNVPSPTGTGASGTWAINISGNAATATSATTAANVTGPVGIANGGTSATTASAARGNLGLAIGSDVPSPLGTGASGTWGINITGNAATATSALVANSASSATTATTATTAGNVSGTVAVANGGTGATTASGARSNLGLAAVAASGSASDLSTGTLSAARMPTTVNSLTFGSDVNFSSVLTPSTITGSVNDYAPGMNGVNVLRISSNAAGYNVTGLAGMSAGQVVLLVNVGSNQMNLLSESASSTAANRFLHDGGGGSLALPANGGKILWYDSASSRVRVLGGV